MGPVGGLIQATNGDFYGTTNLGGDNENCTDGCGTVFKITPSGTLTTLYKFCAKSGCFDGVFPQGALVEATNGDCTADRSMGRLQFRLSHFAPPRGA